MKAHVYDDLQPALQAWKEAGKTLAIYSSGSIAAQKLFFGHTQVGNLLDFFKDHFDTTTGPKREADSYQQIAVALELEPQSILFISDVVEELDAAAQSGFQTALALRPGNKPVETKHDHPSIHSFEEVRLT